MAITNPYVPNVDSFEASEEFTYLAEYFRKNNCYTNMPDNTIQYKEFWLDVKNKCLNGMTNSKGISITGAHFFYLNFCRILRQTTDKIGREIKKREFPRFIDLDYEWFWMIDYCRKNGKNLEAVKGRRQGWSYKAAALCTHEYNFYPDSMSMIGAFLSTFSQTTMNMVIDNCNHLNTHTEFRKQRNPDTKDFIMSRYQVDVSGVKVWKGYMSSVASISFKDKPTAAVGKSATWLILDEAGVFENIKDSYGFSEPLIKDGSTWTGTALIFGSAGDMEAGCEHFYDMFINPRKYNCLEFDDPENPQVKIGFFSSATRGRLGTCTNPTSKWYKQPMVDDQGNSNEEAAFDDLLFLREQARGGHDHKALHNIMTQFPFTYKEAFLRNKGALFASPEMLDWLGKVETLPSLRGEAQRGKLIFGEDNKIEWKTDESLEQIVDFPIKPENKRDGCIVIWEHPEKVGNDVPAHLYIAGCDPYDQDKADSSVSLGSIFIYKRFYQANKTHDIIVAEYTGRPERADDFYENCRKLCIYYNSKCLYENNLKGLKGYFEQKNSLHYLYEQPQILKDIVKDSRVNRGYGIHMNRASGSNSTGIKDQCELYLKQWLYDEKTEVDGQKILNLHTIKSLPLLRELIAYDKEGNYDRCIAFMLCILQSKELHRIHVEESIAPNNTSDFFEKLYQRHLIQTNTNKRNSAFR